MRVLSVSAIAASLFCVPLIAQQERGDKELAFQGTITVPFQDPSNSTTGTLLPRFGFFLTRRNFVGVENEDFLAKGYQAAGISLLYRFYMGSKGSRFQPFVGVAPGLLSQRQQTPVEIIVTQDSLNAAANQINASSFPTATKQFDLNFLNQVVQNVQFGCPVSTASQTTCTPVLPAGRYVTISSFQGSGEIGLKFYMNRKFAFEASYRLQYVDLTKTAFAQNVYTVANSTLTSTSYAVSFTGPTQNDGTQVIKLPAGTSKFKQNSQNLFLFGFSYVF